MTWVLLVIIMIQGQLPVATSVPGYHSEAECVAALQSIGNRIQFKVGLCFPGPQVAG